MFEFHGWAVLRWSDDDLPETEQQRAAIRDAVEAARSECSIAEMSTPGNDLTVVYVHGRRNHRDSAIQRLFEVIAQQAPQSYGLLYVWDQEDPRPQFQNAFRVWRLTRGQLTEMLDPLLSPCIPTIEVPNDARQAQDLALDRYTEQARRALFFARAAVSEHGGTDIADVHLLLGMLEGAPELGPLMRPAVDIQQLSTCLIGAVAASPRLPVSVELPLDAASEAILLEAPRVAAGFGQSTVTPVHLFLAFLEQAPDAAAECLRAAGVELAATIEAAATAARGGPQ
jgi:hypothetical protein